MKKINVSLSIGLAGKQTDSFEVEDNMSNEEIEDLVHTWAYEYIDYGWTVADELGGKTNE